MFTGIGHEKKWMVGARFLTVEREVVDGQGGASQTIHVISACKLERAVETHI